MTPNSNKTVHYWATADALWKVMHARVRGCISNENALKDIKTTDLILLIQSLKAAWFLLTLHLMISSVFAQYTTVWFLFSTKVCGVVLILKNTH